MTTENTTAVKDSQGRKPKYVGCKVETCEEKHYAKEYCRSHYAKFHRTGDPEYVRPANTNTCNQDGCDKPVASRAMCSSHYALWWYYNGVSAPVNSDSANYRETVTYNGAHARIRRAKGRAGTHECVDCNKQAEEWSLKHNAETVHYGSAGQNRPPVTAYSYNVDDYEPRCGDCHKKYDAKHGNRSYKTGQYARLRIEGAA